MSVEFTLSGSSLDADRWDALLAKARREHDLFSEACFVDGAAHLLGPGSIRGVVLSEEEEGIGVRLSACSSRADWKLAYAVVRAALEEGGGTFTREDGETLAAADLTPEAAEEAAVKDFCFAAQVLRQSLSEGGGPSLPIGAFTLQVRDEDVPAECRPEDVPEVERRLAERVERYALAFAASTLVLAVAGKRVRLATWARIPTLIGDVHLVAVEGLERPVPLPRLLELMGDRVERVGAGEREGYYLPELDQVDDAELLAALGESSLAPEQYVEAHGEELEEDSGAAGGGEAMLAGMQQAAAAVAQGLVAGRDVQELKRELLREGLAEDMIDAVFGAAGVILKAIQQQGGLNERSAQQLANSGLPSVLIEAILIELGKAMGEQQREEQGSPALGCTVLAILAALVAVGIYAATR